MRSWLVIVAACGGASTPPAQPLAQHYEEAAPRPGAPTIGWKDNNFVVTGLPAVARGGEEAIVPVIESDGGRGYPNLRLEVRDRSDKVVQTIAVMTPNEYETLAPGGSPSRSLTDRIAAANAELAKAHGVHDLVAMHPLELQAATGDQDAHLAIGDGVDVDWNQDHLHVFSHNTDHSLTTADGAAWLAKDTKHAGGDVCHNPAFLRRVFHATGISALVIEIGFHGTDTCWEPGDQLHLVVW